MVQTKAEVEASEEARRRQLQQHRHALEHVAGSKVLRRKAPGHQIVPGVAVGHGDEVALLALAFDVLL